MRTSRIGTSFVSLLLLLLLLAGLAQAQGPDAFEEAVQQPPVAVAVVDIAGPDNGTDPISFHGRLTDAHGVPVDGTYNIRLSLYDQATGGSALCSITQETAVSNGLFSLVLPGCEAWVFDGRQLWLGVRVLPDPEMTPRSPVYAMPYARSLRPGAIIDQLGITDHALTVKSTGMAKSGTALWVENRATTFGGIGIWSTVNGEDASIVASNNSSGPLFKGFGGDGGEEDFSISNNGAIQSKADSYIWIPGSAFVQKWNSQAIEWSIMPNGSVRFIRGNQTGTKTLVYPVVIPAVLYGQPVKIEEVTIYCIALHPDTDHIKRTSMFKFTGVDSSVPLFEDNTPLCGYGTQTHTISVTNNNVLSATEPGVSLELELTFDNYYDYIQVAGFRIRLGHHRFY